MLANTFILLLVETGIHTLQSSIHNWDITKLFHHLAPPTDMSMTQCENIWKVWMLAKEVMDAFEKGQLKVQSQFTNKA